MPRTRETPAPLAVAASLAAVEGGLLLLYGVLELASVTGGRLTMGLTTGAFFLLYGAAMLVCSWGLYGTRAWGRGPVLFAQLVQVGLAWNLRAGDTAPVAVALAVSAGLVLAGLFHPASVAALERDPQES